MRIDNYLEILNKIEVRFETIIYQYDIQMEDATHFIFLISQLRQELENEGK